MTGYEALRILSECANGEKKLVFTDSLDLQRIVEQDLNRLKKIEKIIETLEELLDVYVSDFRWISLREFLKVLIEDFKDTECVKEWLGNDE